MIHGVHHTAISTGDLDRLLAFYRDLLGFEEVFSLGWPVGTETADRITGLKDSSARFAMLHMQKLHEGDDTSASWQGFRQAVALQAARRCGHSPNQHRDRCGSRARGILNITSTGDR